MATTPAIGFTPFEFTTSQGKQISIPLTAISFDASGTPHVAPPWDSYVSSPPGSVFLAYVIKEKLIAPRPTPSPFPAMILKAADPGSGGNNITVTVAIENIIASPPTTDPTLTQFSFAVTETDNYTGLTLATIESVLGSSAMPGSSPGLVQVVHGSVAPTNELPKSTGGFKFLSGAPPSYSAQGTGSPAIAFILVAKKSGADASLTQVSISSNISSPPGPGAGTFNLQATWTKSQTGISLSDLETMVQSDLGYEITVSKPSSGAYSVPASGTVTFSGGGPGSNASAVLYTGQ